VRSVNAARFRSCFGAGEVRAVTTDGRHPGSGMRTPFTRPPRNRSRRPSSHSVDPPPERAAHAHEPGGGDRGVRGERHSWLETEENAVTCPGSERRSGKRAVKRGSPQSRLHRAAPSLPVPDQRVLGLADQHAREDPGVEEHGVARLRNESDPRSGAESASNEKQVAALGNDGSTSARVGTVSECRSRSDASPVATPVGAITCAPRTRAT